MTRASFKRALIGAAMGIVIAGGLAPFLPIPFLRPGIEQALTRRLGRRVEIGEVSLSLFGGPGFSVSNVTIHEDPRAGIEPFVYAPSVDARVDLLGLLAGRRGFSSLRFSDATLNLVRTRAGEWNFQYLLNARLSGVPSIHLRGTRVNLKFAQTKSVLYFDDADVDITPGDQGSLDLRFAGAPARTDRPAQSFGQLVVRGSWIPTSADRPLNLKVELEPSSFDGLAKLFGRSWFDLQGQVALDARLSGTPSELAVTGEVQLDEGRRSDFLPSRDGKWNLPFRGNVDLADERLVLEKSGNNSNAPHTDVDTNVQPLIAWLEATDFLTSPRWEASVELNDAPVPVVADAARRIGAPLPANVSVEGRLSGTLKYDGDSGLTGNLEAHDAALQLSDAADAPVVRSPSVPISLDAQTIVFGPCPASVGKKASDAKQELPGTQTAQVEASYKFDGSQAADFRIATRGMDLEGLRAFASVPLLGQAAADPAPSGRAGLGTWRGSLRYQRAGEEEGAWTGDYSVENARISIDGIADPVRIQFANVSTGPGGLAVTKIRAKAGAIPFTGEYHFDSTSAVSKSPISKAGNAAAKTVAAIANTAGVETPGVAAGATIHRPRQFKLQVGEATLAEIDRLFKPTLVRGGGFIERTLRLGGSSPVPDWLAQRNVEGTVSIAALTAGERKLAVDSARMVWDGNSAHFSGILGHFIGTTADAITASSGLDIAQNSPAGNSPVLTSSSSNKPAFKGELNVDLSDAAPQYRLVGKVEGFAYKGGRLDFEARVDGAGEGLPLLASLRAAGTLSGRSIAFSPDADFRNVSGHFQASMQGTSFAWKFSDLEVTQGSDVYLGEGVMSPDGKIVLNLVNRGNAVRYTGSLVSAAAQP